MRLKLIEPTTTEVGSTLNDELEIGNGVDMLLAIGEAVMDRFADGELEGSEELSSLLDGFPDLELAGDIVAGELVANELLPNTCDVGDADEGWGVLCADVKDSGGKGKDAVLSVVPPGKLAPSNTEELKDPEVDDAVLRDTEATEVLKEALVLGVVIFDANGPVGVVVAELDTPEAEIGPGAVLPCSVAVRDPVPVELEFNGIEVGLRLDEMPVALSKGFEVAEGRDEDSGEDMALVLIVPLTVDDPFTMEATGDALADIDKLVVPGTDWVALEFPRLPLDGDEVIAVVCVWTTVLVPAVSRVGEPDGAVKGDVTGNGEAVVPVPVGLGPVSEETEPELLRFVRADRVSDVNNEDGVLLVIVLP